MLSFVTNYLGSIVVGLIILGIVILIIIKGIRDKRNGKGNCSCGGDCGACTGCKNKQSK